MTQYLPNVTAGMASTRLHAFYRITALENAKQRPPFYSKRRSLLNFVRALGRVPEASLTVLTDGPPERWAISVATSAGQLVELPRQGNARSFWTALERATELPSHHIVYFVEDDYLHQPYAIERMMDCYSELAVDYCTLYDHPVRYGHWEFVPPDYPMDLRLMVTRSHHWRTVESTCMTFAARVQTIATDVAVFAQHVLNRPVPNDRELFRHLQGLGPYANSSPSRLLLAPVPSLSTHLEHPWLAPAVDWAALAEQESSLDGAITMDERRGTFDTDA